MKPDPVLVALRALAHAMNAERAYDDHLVVYTTGEMTKLYESARGPVEEPRRAGPPTKVVIGAGRSPRCRCTHPSKMHAPKASLVRAGAFGACFHAGCDCKAFRPEDAPR